MKFQIGLRHGAGLLSFETTFDADQLRQQFEEARESGGILDFTDTRGERALVPADSIAYVLIPSERELRVGFGRP